MTNETEGAGGAEQQQQTNEGAGQQAPPPHPPAVSASIATALDIASDEGVNLETAAEYLQGACPGYFADHGAAVAALETAAEDRARNAGQPMGLQHP